MGMMEGDRLKTREVSNGGLHIYDFLSVGTRMRQKFMSL